MSSSHAEQDGHYPISCLIFSLLVVLALLGAAPFAFNFLNGEFHRRMQTESLAFWQAAALTDSGKAMVALVVVSAGLCYFLVSILSQMRGKECS